MPVANKIDLIVKVVDDLTGDIARRLVEIEDKAFGEGGLHNEWLMVPMIRYGRVFTAELEGQLVGSAQFMRAWIGHDTVYFYGVSMLPQYRGQGLGTAFLKDILSYLKKDGVRKVILSVSPQNKRAVHLYRERFGFRTVNSIAGEYGPGEDRLIMECIL
nr:GNAT family N-acetyltransferase [Phosphitispora fastidiosa]